MEDSQDMGDSQALPDGERQSFGCSDDGEELNATRSVHSSLRERGGDG